MAFNEELAERVRYYLKSIPNVEEKRMMGGLTFMVNEKMCVGVLKDELMCRIDPDDEIKALKKEGCRTMDFTKKPMKGFVFVSMDSLKTEKKLAEWLELALKFNPKAKSSKKK